MPSVTVASAMTQIVSVDDVRNHTRIDATDDDSYLYSLVMLAQDRVEVFTRRLLSSRAVTYKIDGFCKEIELPYVPSSTPALSIQYLDTSGATQTVSSTWYSVDSSSTPARIYLNFGYIWPVTLPVSNAVTINYAAGYGTLDEVPVQLLHAIKLICAHFYESRGLSATGAASSLLPITVESLMGPYRSQW